MKFCTQINQILYQKRVKVLPAPMAHREAPISVSVALGHMSANAVKATAGGWSICSSACLTFPLHSLMSARQESSEYHFKSLWYDSAGARTHDLPVVRQTLYHCAITTVQILYTCVQINSLRSQKSSTELS